MTQADGMQEAPQPQALTPESPLPQIQQYLVSEAQGALKQPTFGSRNTRMANAVGLESSLLAARATGIESYAGLTQVFTSASQEAGQEFEGAFDQFGKPLSEKKDDYNAAMKNAKNAAYKNLPGLYEEAGIHIVVDDLLRSIDFNDVIRLTTHNLGIEIPDELTPEYVRQSLHETAKGDYYEGKIDTLPFIDREQRPEDEQKAIELAARISNASWKAGQVHRAAWEGNDSRIDPTQRERQFNPYDLFLKEQFETFSADHSAKEAVVRVSFEAYKDIDNLVRAVPQPAS